MKIGLALGSGSARGWAHIGVLKALIDEGIAPDIVCGTSIGALVGASQVSGNLDKLEQWVCSLTKFDTARFFEIGTTLNGIVNTDRMHRFLNEYVDSDSALIENLGKQYAAVATDLDTGREVWFTRGPVLQAVWSSIALPGLFPAIRHDGKWVVDGGLVNPVPVSVCRAMGADVVIAVNLNGNIVGRHHRHSKSAPQDDKGLMARITDLVSEYTSPVFSNAGEEKEPPGLFEAIAGSINIVQDRITRSRMAGDPPDILLAPRLEHIGLLEFYRAKEAIEEGRECMQRQLPELLPLLGRD